MIRLLLVIAVGAGLSVLSGCRSTSGGYDSDNDPRISIPKNNSPAEDWVNIPVFKRLIGNSTPNEYQTIEMLLPTFRGTPLAVTDPKLVNDKFGGGLTSIVVILAATEERIATELYQQSGVLKQEKGGLLKFRFGPEGFSSLETRQSPTNATQIQMQNLKGIGVVAVWIFWAPVDPAAKYNTRVVINGITYDNPNKSGTFIP